MEQKDYLLREIEKMGTLLKEILLSVAGKKSNPIITPEAIINETHKKLLEGSTFSLCEFIKMNNTQAINYLKSQSGIDIINMELLSSLLEELGLNCNSSKRSLLFEKSLLTLEYCMGKDKTFSFERENRVRRLKSFTQH